MTIRANAELTRLREQMTALAPGVVTNAAETAAPFVARIVGYAELASTFLPQIRAFMDRGASRAVTKVLPAALVSTRRTVSWRTRGLVIALPLFAGLAAYAAWRFRPAPTRHRVPPG